MGGVTRIVIPNIEQEIKAAANGKNKIWLKGGIIAVGLFLGITFIFFLVSLVLGEEARVVARAVMAFPISFIYSLVSDQVIEESWLASIIALIVNSIIYFIIGAIIGLAVKYSKQKLRINHHNHNHNGGLK